MTSILKLHPYQEEGVSWLKTKKLALLGDQMGLGKSAQIIRAIDELQLRRCIIVGPSIARVTWQREFEKWSLTTAPKLKIRILRKRIEEPDFEHDEILICSFDYATHNFVSLSKFKPDLLVVDESHFLKSIESKRTKAILSGAGLIHSSKRTWFLSGTPMPNHPGELWPMMYTFQATNLKYEAFVRRFCHTYEFNGATVISGTRKENTPILKEALDKIMMRRLVRDVLPDLPRVRISELPIEAELETLTPELKEQWKTMENFFHNMPDDLSPLAQLQCLESVAQSIATLRRYCAMMKVKPICDLIKEELENKAYEKIIVFGIHREALLGIEANLQQFGAVRIAGDVDPIKRQEAIDRFQNDPNCHIMVGNIGAAGTNITLTAASEVLFLEEDFVPGNNAQAIARAARIGQKSSVNVRLSSIANTIDEKVSSILTRKLREILEVVG